jgi:hypothetical protein
VRRRTTCINFIQNLSVCRIVVTQKFAILNTETLSPEREVSDSRSLLGLFRFWVRDESTFDFIAAECVTTTTK